MYDIVLFVAAEHVRIYINYQILCTQHDKNIGKYFYKAQ